MFLLFLLMMMMIFSPLSSYVGVMCEDCQMMRKTASVPHESTGRAVADSPRPRDDDDDDDDAAAAAVRWDMPWNTLV